MKKARVKYHNEWEAHIYTCMDSKGEMISVEDVTYIEVSWPSGEKLTYKLKSMPETRSYYDHGHTYNTPTTDYFIETFQYGVKVNMKLRDILKYVSEIYHKETPYKTNRTTNDMIPWE